MNPRLLERVAVADRHGAVGQRLAVDGDAERRAGLVLAAIAAADGPLFVVEDVEVRLRSRDRFPGRLPACRPSCTSGKMAALIGASRGCSLHHHARLHLAVFVRALVLAIGLAQERQRRRDRRRPTARSRAGCSARSSYRRDSSGPCRCRDAAACRRHPVRRPTRCPFAPACLPCGCADRSRRDGRSLPTRRTRPAAGRERHIRCRPCRRNNGSALRACVRAAAAVRRPGPDRCTSGSAGRANS